jgi:hypothetical protein
MTSTPGTDTVAAVRTMAVDATTAEVLTALAGAAVQPVLLKGPAIAHWLYSEGEARTYVDVDLLIAPAQLASAEDVLRGLGFESIVRHYEQGRRLEHDSLWIRPGTPAHVDLHRTLPRTRGVSPQWVWRQLWPRTCEMELPPPGTSVRILDEPARALLVALHVAHHVGYDEIAVKPMADLQRAVAKLPLAVWRDAAALARTLRAEPQMSRGLHAIPDGVRLVSELGLPAPSSEYNEAAGFERLAASRTWGDRVRLLARVLLPSPAYLRWSSKLARRGRLGFAVAYLTHPIVVAIHAPRGYLIWRRYRSAPSQPGERSSRSSA